MAKKIPSKLKQTEFSLLRFKTGLSLEQLSADLGFSVRTLYRWEKGEQTPRQVALQFLKLISKGSFMENSNQSKFRFIDLFAGIGGLRKGFETFGGSCVFTSEWNLYSRQTYMANFDCQHPIAGDITKISAEKIPEHDLLLAGFPCQPFSIAGVSKKISLNRPHGFMCEAQGTLFFDVARIIEYHRPRAFLLENVKNLVNHDKGRTFKVIYKTLTEELGYNVQYRVLDARSWVPQHRERIFIVGFKDRNNFDFHSMNIPHSPQEPKLERILYSAAESELTTRRDSRYMDKNGKALSKYTLSDKLWNYLQNYAKKHKENGNGFGFGLFGPNDVARTLSARYYKDGSEILIKQGSRNPRRLTPRECARLMGFDKFKGSDFIIPVSDTQAYKQFGNAVVVPVVKAIANHMLPFIVKKDNLIIANREMATVG